LIAFFRADEQCPLAPQVDFVSRLVFNLMDKLGIYAGAFASYGPKRRGIFLSISDQHTGCGMGSLSSRFAAVEYQHGEPALP
jgi:hypothetical protein